jgi:hypothetical protein
VRDDLCIGLLVLYELYNLYMILVLRLFTFYLLFLWLCTFGEAESTLILIISVILPYEFQIAPFIKKDQDKITL